MGLAEDIRAAAQRYGVDPEIFYRQMVAESGLDPDVIYYRRGSSAGAQGIAQFIPSTAAAYGVNLNDNSYLDDLDGAARYMRDLLAMFGGNYAYALAGYNAGPGRVQEYGGVPPPSFANGETYNYVQKIMNGNVPSGGTPVPGAPGAGEGGPPVPDAAYYNKQARWKYLDAKIFGWENYVSISAATGVAPDPSLAPTMAELQEYATLSTELDELDAYYESQGGGLSPSEQIAAYNYYNQNNPEAIAAENAAARYARELEVRTLAISQAANQAQLLRDQVAMAQDSKNNFFEGLAEGRRTAVPTPTPAKVHTLDELFQKSIDKIKEGLPEVPDMPVPHQIDPVTFGGSGASSMPYPGSSPITPGTPQPGNQTLGDYGEGIGDGTAIASTVKPKGSIFAPENRGRFGRPRIKSIRPTSSRAASTPSITFPSTSATAPYTR